MVGTYHGNKIDKLGKMIYGPNFPPKYYKCGWERRNVTTQKKSSLKQSSSLHNQIHDIVNPKYLKKEREKDLKYPQEWLKDETIETHSPAIHLKGWTIKGSCPPSVEPNAEFRS